MVTILCDGIKYPNNAGALVRSAALFGADEIIFSPPPELCEDHKRDRSYILDNGVIRYTQYFIRGTKRYSMEHMDMVNVTFNVSLKEYIEKEQSLGTSIYVLENYGTHDISKSDLTQEKIIIIAGSEHNGVSKYVQEKEFTTLYIPTAGGDRSFNVGHAVTVAMYECWRQRH